MISSLKFWIQVEDVLLPTADNPTHSSSVVKNPQFKHPSSSLNADQKQLLQQVFHACLPKIFGDDSSSHVSALALCLHKQGAWGVLSPETLADPRVQKFLQNLQMSPSVLELINTAFSEKLLTADKLAEFWTPYLSLIRQIDLPLGPLLEWLASGYHSLSQKFIHRFAAIFNKLQWSFKEPQLNFHVEKNLQENIAGPDWNVFTTWLKDDAAPVIARVLADKSALKLWQDLGSLSNTTAKVTLYLYNEQGLSEQRLAEIYPDLKAVAGVKDVFSYTTQSSLLTLFDQLIWELQLAPYGKDEKSLSRATKILLNIDNASSLKWWFAAFRSKYKASLKNIIGSLWEPKLKRKDPRTWSKVHNTIALINFFTKHPQFEECYSIVRLIKELIPNNYFIQKEDRDSEQDSEVLKNKKATIRKQKDYKQAEFVKALHGLGLLRSLDRVIQSEARFLDFVSQQDLAAQQATITQYFRNTFALLAQEIDKDNLALLAELNLWFDGNLAHVGLHALISHMINEWDNATQLPDDGQVIGWLGDAILDLMLPFFNQYYCKDSYDYRALNQLTDLIQAFQLHPQLFYLSTKIAAENEKGAR